MGKEMVRTVRNKEGTIIIGERVNIGRHAKRLKEEGFQDKKLGVDSVGSDWYGSVKALGQFYPVRQVIDFAGDIYNWYYDVQKKDVSAEPKVEYKFGSEEAFEEWRSTKPESYALAAVMIDAIVENALEARESKKYPPFGLVRYYRGMSIADKPNVVTSINTADCLDNGMLGSLVRASQEVIDRFESPIGEYSERDAKLKTVYDRLKSLLKFKKENVHNGDSVDDTKMVEMYIQAGISTASEVMSQFIFMIPQVYRNEGLDFDPVKMTATAKNSFKLIAELAGDHFYRSLGKQIMLQSECNDRRFFEAENFVLDNDGGLKIRDSSLLEPHLVEFALDAYEPHISGPDTAGCPGMVRFGRTPIKQLWDWNVDMSPVIYEKMRQEMQSYQVAV